MSHRNEIYGTDYESDEHEVTYVISNAPETSWRRRLISDVRVARVLNVQSWQPMTSEYSTSQSRTGREVQKKPNQKINDAKVLIKFNKGAVSHHCVN